METANRKSIILNRIFYIILALLILASVGVTFVKYIVNKNYQIVAETSCEPALEKCFIYTNEESGEVSYYKMISKNAASILACEATEEKLGCNEELSCTDGELNCEYTYCDTDNLEEGEACAE